MKKTKDKATKHRQLVLRREIVTELTPRQLKNVVGGWTWDDACASQEKICAEDPI